MGGATLHIAIVLLAVLSSSVHGKTRTDCLPERYQPSNVTITKGIKKKPELYVNGELFEVKGIGYSPIPPGKNTLNEQFDFFTSDRDYIWKRDVPIIANMGANVIRTWSWDATLDHTAFLNLCHHHGLKVLIPFGVTPIEYPDLADPATRHQLMTDWKAFIHKVRNHPALFGYMIGNELNEAYAGQFEELFSAVNAMVALRDEYDSKKHPITLPFSDNNFMEDLVEKYYPWLNIDFWSLQIYRDAINIDSVSSEYSELFLEPDLMSVKKGMFHQLPIKPLIFTEYGIDALDGDTCESWNRSCTTKEVTRLMLSDTPVSQNETKQALGFCNRYSAIRNGTYNTSAYVNGGVIMEYVDEWWKGTFPDVRREECPNQRTDVHTYCASNINKHNNNTKADFLHEEWLGLFRQIPTLADTNKLVEDMDYCIHPRLAQCVMGLAFELKSSADLDCMGLVLQCNQTFNQHPVPQYCATKKTLWNNYIMMWIVPPMLILIAVIVILRVYLKRGWRSLMMMDYQQLNDHSPELEPEQEGPSANEQGVGVNGEAAKSANPDIIDVSKNEPRCDNLLGGIDPKIIEKECKVLENIINQAFWKYTAARSEESTFTKWAEPKVKGANSVNVEQFFEQHLRNKPCPHFVLAQKKIYHAVYDQFSRHIMDTKLSDRTDKDVECKRLMGRAVRIVFEKYTEGYYLYLDRPSPEENDVKKSIEILSLYMLTQQWSGTINHAPEKICELLNWSLQYFENISKKDAVILDSNCERLKKRWEERTGWVINYHYGLVEIIRTYCLKVQEGFSFDDINSDSIYIRKRLMKQNKDVGSKSSSDFLETPSCLQSETIIGTEGDLLPTKSNIQNRRSAIHGTHLEYNSACRPEEVVTSYSANHFFKSRLPEGNTDGKFLPKNIAFPQRGGVFSLLLNYQWLIRYLVWQNMLASVMQPETVSTPECKQTFVVSGLGIADATMCAVFCFCHRITLGRFKRRLLFETFFYTGSCIMVWITFVFSDYLSFVCHYLNGSCQGNKGPDVLGFTIDVPTVYLLIAVLLAIIDEVRLFAWTYQSNAIKGRFKSMDHYRSVRIGYAICCITGIVIFIILKASSFYSFNAWSWWPHMDSDLLVIILPIGCLAGGHCLSRVLPKCSSTYHRSARNDLEIKEESRYVALNIVFWGMFFALNWMLAFYVLIPAVNNIGLDICDCSDAEYSLDQTQVENCKGKVKLMCDVGVIFVWISAYLVSFVFLYAVFVTLLLLFGIARAKYIRVGNVQDWNDVERFWGTILKRSLPEVSKSLTPLEPTPQQIKNGDYVTDDRFVMNEGLSLHQSTVWNCLVDSLYRDDLLSSDEMDALKVSIKTDLESRQLVPNFRLKPRSKEAQRRVISYMWGLESLAAHDGHHEKAILKGGDFTSGLRKSHRVYAMPSFTTIVPIYNEAILLSRENIKRMRDHGKSAKRITELEYLALVYSAEWQNFAQKMDNKHSGSWILDKKQKENLANELLHAFIGQEHPKPLEDKKDAQLIRDIELWASMRGQTLARTIKGLCNIRLGIEQLCVLEEPDMTPRQIMMLVARKYQILISHQTFNLSLVGQNDGKLSQQENALVHMFRTEKYLEVVTNDDTVFQSHCLKLRDVLLYPPKENDIRHRDPRKTMEAIENETAKLQTKINLQFDTLMKWYGNKSTVLPEGTMVRMNNTGTWEKKNQKDIGRPDMKKLFGGKWQEGVVMKFTPAPVVSELRKFTPDELQSVQESRRLSPSLDTAKKLQLLGLEVCPSDNGVLVKRDTGIVFSFNVTGYTLTKYEIKMENTNTTVKNEPTTDNFLEAMCDTGKEVSFTFTRIPGWGDSNMGKYEIKLDNGDTQKDVLFDRVEPFPWTCQTVQRVSPLKIGEGKAENQIHALPFARGDVLQAMDMNQYATSDQGMKIPFLLNDFFSTPDEKTLSACMNGDDGWDHNILIPPFRIVGFPENCYTRDLSMVGELMGAAEWCFVTINQRVLSWPLRTRAHYGHPDFFDGYWARTRGGTSKASLKVNTNEDIFAGYEMLGRGERGSYVEFLEVHKGRETAFPNAYGFEVKLAQGAAQQIRSLDIYMLNRKLDLFSRFSLFYGSLAFYVTNFIMAISINYYILSIVLFAMSGVSYHQLGLMDAIIAIPWLLQVGYVLAIPMIVELVLQKGFLRGVVEFIVTLPIAVFFFIFHMRTKTYYFGKGLLVGSGGYVATGRGFGLERQNMKEMYQTYSESHFLEGFLILLCLIMYAVYGSDPIVPYLARTFTIILITISWLWAPIIFNPMPTTQELQSDLSAMMDWISTKVRHCTVEEADKMDRALQSVQKARELTLEYNMTEETTEEKDASNANETTVIGDADSSSGYDSDSGGAVGRNPEEEKKKWFALLYHNEHTSFTWKPGIKKNPLVPNIDARKKEVFVSVEGQCDIPNIGLDFKEQVLKELKTKEKPTDTELEQKNIMVLSFKDEAAVKGLGDLPKEFDLAVGNNMRARVKVETFAQWSQNRIPSFKSYEEMVAQYWKTENGKRNTADESWKAWYIQYVVFKMWQSEDEHSKTPVQFISTTIIKVYLYAEFYLPWVLISFAFWNMESLWLVIVGVFLAGLFYVIDYNTRDRHDYPQLIKAITLLMLPFAYMYYSTALITAKELFWSAVFYVLGLTIIARIAMGVRNIEARDVGVDAETSGNSIEDARRSDVTRLNNKEAREAKVFYKRLMIWPGWIAFRSITPFCIMVLLAIGNFLAVALSTWLTAMLYNGAVAEAWRKAYFSSSSATPPPPSDSPGPRGFSNVVLETAPSPIAQATIDAVNTSTGKKIKKKVNRGKQAHGVRSARNVTTIQESDNNAGVEEAF